MSGEINDVIAVILAGGYGTRIKHLLNDVPKPMASVAGKPFVEWVVRYLGIQGINQAILSTGYLAEVVEQHFQKQPVNGVQTFCCQETNPLGTGGGFLNAVHQIAVHQITEPPRAWLVLNGDSLVFADFTSLITHLAEEQVGGVMLGLAVTDTSRYGSLECDEKGYLVGFKEKHPGSGVINAGVYLLRHSLLKEFPHISPLSLEHEVFPALLTKGMRLKVHTVQAPFLDIGTPESLAEAENFVEQNYSQLIG